MQHIHTPVSIHALSTPCLCVTCVAACHSAPTTTTTALHALLDQVHGYPPAVSLHHTSKDRACMCVFVYLSVIPSTTYLSHPHHCSPTLCTGLEL